MPYTCPHCHRIVKNLTQHLKRMHPEIAGDTNETEDTSSGGGNQNLDIKTPEGATQAYHCADCGGPLTKGQTPCPGCGANLNWGGNGDDIGE